jgi:hypothetical protein
MVVESGEVDMGCTEVVDVIRWSITEIFENPVLRTMKSRKNFGPNALPLAPR